LLLTKLESFTAKFKQVLLNKTGQLFGISEPSTMLPPTGSRQVGVFERHASLPGTPAGTRRLRLRQRRREEPGGNLVKLFFIIDWHNKLDCLSLFTVVQYKCGIIS
jgi:hypothetical protein